MELYKKYRPTSLKQVIGQTDALKVLQKLIAHKEVPHAILFSGPSGCGKTTLARILKTELQCSNNDFVEVNAADSRGIDSIREIRSAMSLSPMGGKSRIWLLDECHQYQSAAQSMLLKLLEDTPRHVYFMLATTDPRKLLSTIHSRCTEIKLGSVEGITLGKYVKTIAEKEGKKLDEEVADRLVESADGSVRKALVLLDQVIRLDTPDEQLDAIQSSDSRKSAFDIAKALLYSKKWHDVKKLLETVDADPEEIRRVILGFASKVVIGGGKAASRAYMILCAFEGDFYASGKAGLVRACWEVMSQ